MSDPILITFRIDSVVRYPGDDVDQMITSIDYPTPGISVRRLLAIHGDFREHEAAASRRYGTDHYIRSDVIMEIRRGDDYRQDINVTPALPLLRAEVDAIETNPELSAAERRTAMPKINTIFELVAWRDRNKALIEAVEMKEAA